MKNSEESDEDIEDSAVWSSLIGNIVAIIISAYLWLLQQNPNRKNSSNFNPDLLNNALKDLKQLALELTKQNETNNNESQCQCTSENQKQPESKNDDEKTDEGESAEKPSETVENVNTYTVEKENKNKVPPEDIPQKSVQKEKHSHNHEKICDICIECLHNAISQTSTSTKSSTFNQEYRPYQEPEHGKKPKCKSKKYDKNKIKKGIADAQRAIKYLQDMQEQFDSGSSQPNKNTCEENLQKSNKKTTFQANDKASEKQQSPENQQNRRNRTVIQYDSDYGDELAPDDCLQCSSSCSIVKLDQTPCQSAKQNPNSTMKDKAKSRFPQKQYTETDYEQSYSEDSSQLLSQQSKGKPKNNNEPENCTYMKDPCQPCERLDLADAEKNYMEAPPSPPVESNELDEETCTYMQDPCKPCEPVSNVPTSRLPRLVPKPEPRKQHLDNFEGDRAGACADGGRLCKSLRQPNVTSPVYQSVGNRGYAQRPKSPRTPNGYPSGYPQNNYGQAYSKTPAADSRRQDYQSFNPRQSPRGNYPPGYVNPKYEKAMNTLTVERMDASSETGEFTPHYNQYPTSNQQQYLQQMQPNQYPNQQGRQREFVNGNRGRDYKRPILFQQTEDIEYTQYPNGPQPRDYGEVRYRNEELQPMPVAAIPLKTSSNTIDVSKCPRYLK